MLNQKLNRPQRECVRVCVWTRSSETARVQRRVWENMSRSCRAAQMSDTSTVGHGTAWGPSQIPQCTGAGWEAMARQNGESHALTLRYCVHTYCLQGPAGECVAYMVPVHVGIHCKHVSFLLCFFCSPGVLHIGTHILHFFSIINQDVPLDRSEDPTEDEQKLNEACNDNRLIIIVHGIAVLILCLENNLYLFQSKLSQTGKQLSEWYSLRKQRFG